MTLLAHGLGLATSRRCCMMEIDALYCDVIVERRRKVTGRKAERVEETA